MKVHLIRTLLMALAGCTCVQTFAEPLPVELLTEWVAPREIAMSPDGTWVAAVFVTRNHDAVWDGSGDMLNAYRSFLQVINTRSGETLLVGPKDREASLPAWSADSKQLMFQVGMGDAARPWLWSAVTRQIRQAANIAPRRFNAPFRWLPDGRHVLTIILPDGMTNETIRQRMATSRTDTDYPLDPLVPGAQVAVYRAATVTRSGDGNKTAARQDPSENNRFLGDLALIDTVTGQHRRLTTGYRPTLYRLSPDGRLVSFTHIAGNQEGSSYRTLYDLMVVPLDGGAPRAIARDVLQQGINMDASWSPDSRYLAYFESGPATQNDCYLADAKSGKIRKLPQSGRQTGQAVRPPVWNESAFYAVTPQAIWRTEASDLATRRIPAPEGETVLEVLSHRESGAVVWRQGKTLILRTRNSTTKDEGFFALDPVSGASTRLHTGPLHFGAVNASRDAAVIVYTAQSVDAGEQIWLTNADFHTPQQLSKLNPQLHAYRLGKSRLVRWQALDGVELHGALLLPSDYQPGRRYPLIVYPYGDRKRSDELNIFGFNDFPLFPYENMQLLASRGYAVLLPDTITRIGTPMHDIAASLLPAIDKLVEEGLADPQRLGIMGRSYGAYSVLSVLVQTQRFKAAIVTAGTASMLGVFSQMKPRGDNTWIFWAEEHQGKMGGSLWEYRDRYIANSPLFQFDRIGTPVLIAHGTEDTAVAVHQGDEIFQALRRLGKEVTYAKYLGEPHVIVSRANGIDYAKRMIEWFDLHLKPAARDGEESNPRRAD